MASCISSAIIPQPPKVDDDKCTATAVREAQATLLQACTDAKAFRLENAAKEYAGVLKSCDLQSRMSAIAGYREVNQAMELWWWRWGKYVPGLRWWYEYPDESDWLTWKLGKKLWASFGAFLKILADLLLLALIVFYILRPLAKAGAVVLYALISFPSRAKTWYLTRENQKGGRWFSIHRVRDQMSGAMAWAQDAWKKPGARTLKRVLDWYSREHTEWILPFLGEARLVLPDCVNDTSEHELFRRQLNACTEEIRTRVQNTGVSWIAGSTALLSLPSAVTDDLVKNLPAIKGANFGPIFAWFLSLFKYFGWRAECGETYLEDSKTIEAFASLHWAWITRKRWQISTPAASKSDLSLTARKLAMQILSVRFDNRRAKTRNEFENGEHFLLFTQAAYGLQRYEEIGQVESPDRGAMQKELQSATGKFEQCVSLYPSHALGRFYLAYTHILLNQDALVVPELAERIETLRDEPVYVPSSYLDRAIELFEELAGEDHEWLKPIVTYNWAKALVKRDRPATASVVADLTTAKDTVTELSKKLDDGSLEFGGTELAALRVQCKILLSYIEARQATPPFEPMPTVPPDVASTPGLSYLSDVPEYVRSLLKSDPQEITGREGLDLATDSKNAIGYLCYELARSSRSKLAQRKSWLDAGDKALDEALVLKPGWTPAQINKLRITIERLRLLHSTGATGHEFNLTRKTALDLLISIQGVEPNATRAA